MPVRIKLHGFPASYQQRFATKRVSKKEMHPPLTTPSIWASTPLFQTWTFSISTSCWTPMLSKGNTETSSIGPPVRLNRVTIETPHRGIGQVRIAPSSQSGDESRKGVWFGD